MRCKILLYIFGFILFGKLLLADQVLDGIYYDWSTFVLDELGNEKKCYIVSFPKKSIGNYKSSREPYILITRYKDREVEEVSLYVGFEYKIASNVHISIDGKQYTLFTKNDIAWAKSKEQDKEIISNLLDAYDLKVRAESVHAEYIVDEYSLKGITRAYKKMKELCRK